MLECQGNYKPSHLIYRKNMYCAMGKKAQFWKKKKKKEKIIVKLQKEETAK